MIEPITSEQMKAGFAVMTETHRKSFIAVPKQIIATICAVNDCPVSDVLSAKRNRTTAHVRQDCMLEIRERTSLSLPQIGRIFGRDHTTVQWGIQRAKQRRLEARL